MLSDQPRILRPQPTEGQFLVPFEVRRPVGQVAQDHVDAAVRDLGEDVETVPHVERSVLCLKKWRLLQSAYPPVE